MGWSGRSTSSKPRSASVPAMSATRLFGCWSRFLLNDSSQPDGDRIRAVLRINERIFRKCSADLHFRAIYLERGVDPFEAVLTDDDRLPEAFRQRRYPQMRDRLSERRQPRRSRKA
jgi:hypothetical protein